MRETKARKQISGRGPSILLQKNTDDRQGRALVSVTTYTLHKSEEGYTLIETDSWRFVLGKVRLRNASSDDCGGVPRIIRFSSSSMS